MGSWISDIVTTLQEEPPKLPRPLPGFRSTVDSWNRERDRRRVEAKLGLREEGRAVKLRIRAKTKQPW